MTIRFPSMHHPAIATARPWIAATLAALLAACSAESAGPAGTAAPMTVPVANPDVRTVPVALDLPGHVEAIERVELRPRVSGTIVRVAFTEGARVRKGDLLFEIDRARYAATLAAAEAELREADAQARIAAAEAARASRLVQRKAISAEDAERRDAEAAVARARRDAAGAAVEQARIDLGHTRVLAPIDGRVGRAEQTAGNLVSPDDRLAVLVADARVYVRFDVTETALAGHAPSAWRARFTLPEAPQHEFEGALAFIDNEISAGTGTVRTRITLDGHPALVPGRYGHVTLELGERAGALLIDETAIGADQGTRYVLVVDANGRVHYRPVVPGPRVGRQRVIEQGLAPDDRVVIAGLMGVRPGMTVAAQEATATVEADAATALATATED